MSEERGVNENAFWMFKRRTEKRKTELRTAMVSSSGETTENEEEVKSTYMEFYKTLLATIKATSPDESEAEQDVNKTFRANYYHVVFTLYIYIVWGKNQSRSMIFKLILEQLRKIFSGTTIAMEVR